MEVTKRKSLELEEGEGVGSSAPMKTLVAVASIAAGIQFGWALQLSLLTPYVQLLGIPHKWAPLIWLCGPISGMIVQPIFSASAGAGQSMSLGVLNITICIPQMIVSVGSEPFDTLFGGGNLVAFVVGAVAAAVSAILALTVLPSPPADASATKTIALGPH